MMILTRAPWMVVQTIGAACERAQEEGGGLIAPRGPHRTWCRL